MLKETPILPSTVTDQIRLWQLERDRFKFSDGVLYNQFLSQNDFELLRNYARVGILSCTHGFIITNLYQIQSVKYRKMQEFIKWNVINL